MHDIDWAIVPSIWWENAPLIIQESFACGRPVIAANAGGMAEAVRDGIDGILFTQGDARSLAKTMERAIEQRDLWKKLRSGIIPPRTISESAEDHLSLYERLLSQTNVSRRRAG
jgi:glycosyltransferase involved in cell wall biosynthesis